MNDFTSTGASTENGDREAAPQEPGADTTTAGTASDRFRATWVGKADGSRIGKVQKASGKWPPTPGAASKRFLIEVKEYPGGLDEFGVDYEARMKAGSFALVAGEPRPGLNLGKPHNRAGENLIDAASTRFVLDFDGLEPDDADTPIDSAGAYSESVIPIVLARLPKAFRPAKCMVSTTSSTGLKTVSTGAPSEGKARFRGTWELSRALTCGQKKTLAKALKARPGLGCIDGNLYSPEHFEFVARPVFLTGGTDPIAEPVYMLGGGLLDVDAVCAEIRIDLEHGVESGDAPSRMRAPSPGPGRPQAAKPGLALDLPPEQAEPLLRALLTAIGNGSGLRDDYNEWFGVIAAIFNASKGADWGLDIADEWTASGDYDTAAVYDKWKRLKEANDGRNGIDYLIKLAVALAKEKKAEAKAAGEGEATEAAKAKADAARAKTAELETAVSGIDRARAAATGFPDIDDEDLDRMSAPAPNPVIARMNARYAFVESISTIFDLRPGKFGNGEKRMPQIVQPKEMEARCKNKFVRVGKRDVNWFQYWFAHPDRNEFSAIGCYPPDRVPRGALNMFEGFAVPAVKGSWARLERFLRQTICGNEPGAYGYLYKLVCWWVQNPCVTPEIAIVLLGPQGIGKSVFVLEFLGGLIGHRHLLHFTNPRALVADHNEEWAWPLLRFFNEMTYGHDKAISGMLKALDTEKEIRINPKFVKAYMTPNLAFNTYATNENSGGLPLDHDDRRKLVLDVATSKKEDHAYFEDLTRALKSGELSAFLHDALREDLTGFNRRKVYKTRARTEVADTTATPEAAFLVHVLEQGVLPDGQWKPKPVSVTSGWIAARGNTWPTSVVAVSTQALFGAYLDWVSRQRGKQTHSLTELYREFKSKLGDEFVKEQIRDPGDPSKREWRYRFASLGDCRAAFDAFCGRPREWASASSATILQFPDLGANDEEEMV